MRIQRKLAATLSGALLASGFASLGTPAFADVDNYDRGCEYFENGNGSAADPYQIADGDDLHAITWANCYDEFNNYYDDALEANAYFIQVADIDLSEWDSWNPIGNIYNPWDDVFEDINGNYGEGDGGYFNGNYDGQNHSIINVNIVDDGHEHRSGYGIFGHTDGATIENLSIDVYTDVSSYFEDDINHDYYFNSDDTTYGHYDHDLQNNDGFTGWIDWDDSVDNQYDGFNEYYYWDYEIDTCWYGSSVGSLVGNAEDTTIRNITANVEVRGAYEVGGLVGSVDSDDQGTQIINVDVTGLVDTDETCGFADVGGLIGDAENDTQLINSDIAVNVTSDFDEGDVEDRFEIDYNDFNYLRFDELDGDNVGGVVGWTEYSLYINSHASGSVSTNESENVGGFAGWAQASSFIDSSASGDVRTLGEEDDIGGLIGELQTDDGSGKALVQNSFATGDVVGGDSDYVGGLIGATEDDYEDYYVMVSVVDSYATGNVSGDYKVGGLIGDAEIHSIVNSYATGDVVGTNEYIGGLAGYMDDYSTVMNSYATGDVTGPYYAVGGLVGYHNGRGMVSKSYATGDVRTPAGNSYEFVSAFGGLIGYADDDLIVDKSYSTGTVDVSNSYVSESYDLGGLIGVVDQDVTIRASYSTSDVVGHVDGPMGESWAVGGLIGSIGDENETPDIMVKNSYSLGDVTGSYDVAGFIGRIEANPENIEMVNNYTASKVSALNFDMFANTYGNGGYNMFPWAITNMFVSEKNVGSDAFAVAVKAANLKQASTLQAAGWNISETGRWSTKTWSTCSKVNEGLPYLSWQTTEDLCICEGVVIPAIKFTTGSSKLSADSVAAITAAAEAIKAGKCKNVALVGFTNTVKSNRAAKALADARSSAVRTALKAALWEVGHPVKFSVARDTKNTTQTRWNKVTITAAE
jgi:outer membrane protein OmpA-like peptidoglycan-associated protein